MEVAKIIKLQRSILRLLCFFVLAPDRPVCNGDKVLAHLRLLNKPPLRSFMSPDGDIIDCVHITQQLAFDHPSLKNHSIQMRPSCIPKGFSNNKEMSIKQMWHMNGKCPEETIPVKRTKREDVLRAISAENYGKKQHKAIPLYEPPATTQHEYAVAYDQGGKYYGAKATINVWAPKIQNPNEFSLSQLWVVGGTGSEINTIEAGWQVYPNMYGDYQTRLFIYWTRDSYQRTGCYNLLCWGFIQTNNQIAIGGSISPASLYGGTQYAITMLVWKDPNGGNWWLKIGDNVIGYWPSNLFNRLNTGASLVEWGGEVVNLKTDGKHTTTEMGSGYFPNQGFGKASFFNNIQTVDGSNTLRSPNNLATFARPSASCYDIQIGKTNLDYWGSYFYYGGTGRNAACP